eukprot:2809659-Rhodomonas_salina.1
MTLIRLITLFLVLICMLPSAAYLTSFPGIALRTRSMSPTTLCASSAGSETNDKVESAKVETAEVVKPKESWNSPRVEKPKKEASEALMLLNAKLSAPKPRNKRS